MALASLFMGPTTAAGGRRWSPFGIRRTKAISFTQRNESKLVKNNDPIPSSQAVVQSEDVANTDEQIVMVAATAQSDPCIAADFGCFSFF